MEIIKKMPNVRVSSLYMQGPLTQQVRVPRAALGSSPRGSIYKTNEERW